MNNIIECKLQSTYKEIFTGLWQYDYGQILRITGGNFPKTVEIQFSLNEKSGSVITRIGTTTDGVTEVQIPDELLKNEGHSQDYSIYAYIYLTDETSGNTEYQIVLHVKSRTKPENPSEEPLPEPNIFHETVEAVNASAERAEKAEQKAKASATEAGKYAASASESAVAAEKTKEAALKEVGEKKQEAIEAIQKQEETSVGKITTHTDGEIQRIQNQIAESKGELEQTITNASVSKEELEHSIETAGTSKTALDKSTELAGTAKTELDTSIQKAGTAKNALDKSTETARTVQETLSATVKQAGALDASLGEKIETGTELKTDLVASGKKAVQDIKTAGSEQLGKMQEVAEEFTADRKQITTNKEDIGSLKEDLSNKITKFYASNQGETHLADSDNGKIEDMMLYGKSEQFTTTGKNLLKIRDRTQTTRGVTVTAKDGVVTLKGTATETGWAALDVDTFALDGTYILSSNTTGLEVKLVNKSWKAVLIQNKSKTLENAEVSRLCFGVREGKTYDISNILVQIEKGSEATPYEPYTGGIPSPSPEYPQEIKSVVNPVIKVCGKNLFDFSRLVSDGVNAMNYEKQTITVPAKTNNTGYNQTLRDLCPGITPGTYVFSMKRSNPESGNGSYFLEAMKDFPINTPIELTDELLDNHISWYNSDTSEVENVISEIQIEKGNVVTSYEPYHEQTVTIPYTLNAIPVASGGNVTIDGQQYIADYVDVERGKVVRMCERKTLNTKTGRIDEEYRLAIDIDPAAYDSGDKECMLSAFEWNSWATCAVGGILYIKNIKKPNNELYTAQELKELSLDFDVVYQLLEQQETDLTAEQTQALKEFASYYPVTNISVNSEQLDGYTVFNYPISMANGWNYVKQQLNDNRDYIYDMDARTQDTDLQSAEAYVNSEYAVALTELEVM